MSFDNDASEKQDHVQVMSFENVDEGQEGDQGPSDQNDDDARKTIKSNLKTIKEQTEYQSSVQDPSQLKIETDFDLLDDNDAEFRNFQNRKMTIMTNITYLAKHKYHDNESKQADLINQVAAALEHEEMSYRRIRKSIKRKTVRKRRKRMGQHRTQDDNRQFDDFDYQVFKLTERKENDKDLEKVLAEQQDEEEDAI